MGIIAPVLIILDFFFKKLDYNLAYLENFHENLNLSFDAKRHRETLYYKYCKFLKTQGIVDKGELPQYEFEFEDFKNANLDYILTRLLKSAQNLKMACKFVCHKEDYNSFFELYFILLENAIQKEKEKQGLDSSG